MDKILTNSGCDLFCDTCGKIITKADKYLLTLNTIIMPGKKIYMRYCDTCVDLSKYGVKNKWIKKL